MLQCRSGATFLSLVTSVWSLLYRNDDDVYLGHNTCKGAVSSFIIYTPIMYEIRKDLCNKDTNMV